MNRGEKCWMPFRRRDCTRAQVVGDAQQRMPRRDLSAPAFVDVDAGALEVGRPRRGPRHPELVQTRAIHGLERQRGLKAFLGSRLEGRSRSELAVPLDLRAVTAKTQRAGTLGGLRPGPSCCRLPQPLAAPDTKHARPRRLQLSSWERKPFRIRGRRQRSGRRHDASVGEGCDRLGHTKFRNDGVRE